MAQHDYSIANQTFPNTRTDLNNVLSAISSNNSGTSAPSTTFANQFWYDTSTSSKLNWYHRQERSSYPGFIFDHKTKRTNNPNTTH